MQVVVMPMDIDVCLMSQARLVGEQDHYTTEFHNDGIAGKVPSHFHVLFQRLVIMIAAHKDFLPRQPQKPLHSFRAPGAVTKMDNCVLWLHPLSPVPADDRVKVFRSAAALYHGVMAKVRISDDP